MMRSTGEERGLLVKWPSKNDAHRWLRNDDHRPRQPRGRIKYGYNRVQEIVSGTPGSGRKAIQLITLDLRSSHSLLAFMKSLKW